jgi:hypothetical protein
MTILLTLFAAGVLTILLPCILPLVPIVLGVSLSGRNKWRPLVTAAGMAASFVTFTFVLQILLRQFVQLADLARVATYYALLLFWISFAVTQVQGANRHGRLGRPSLLLGTGLAGAWDGRNLGCAGIGAGGASGGATATGRSPGSARSQRGFRVGVAAICPGCRPDPGIGLGTVRGPGARVRADPGARPARFSGLPGAERRTRWEQRCPSCSSATAGKGSCGLRGDWSGTAGKIKQASGAGPGSLGPGLPVSVVHRTADLAFRTHAVWRPLARQSRSVWSAMPWPTPAGPPSYAMSAKVGDTALPQLPNLAQAPELVGLGPWYNSPPLTPGLAQRQGRAGRLLDL